MHISVITFHSVAHAFRAEKILRQNGIAVKLIPVPRSLSGSCDGLAAQLAEADVDRSVDILTKASIEMLQKGVSVLAD